MSGYNASKAAVLGYTGMLRMELPEHITISLLCPGWTRTEIGNSGTKRQDKFGGPKPARPHFPQEGDHMPMKWRPSGPILWPKSKRLFYIFPHYASRHLAEERNNEIIALLKPKLARQRIGKKTILAAFLKRCKRSATDRNKGAPHASIESQ